MKVPLLDLAPQHQALEADILGAMMRVVRSGQFILGDDIGQLEEEIGRYCGAPYAVGVSSGTDALLASLMALGVKAGDIVITSAFSFFGTAGVIARLGARPVFTDVVPDTFNMSFASLEETWQGLRPEERERVRVMIPVHLFGQCADMGPILRFAQQRGIAVVEDGAQALGAECLCDNAQVRKAGTMGVAGCFSFFPTKNLGAFGDGGMAVTSDAELAERLRVLRVHGAKPKYYHFMVGGNFRLDTLQAAVLRIKLPHLDDWHRLRRQNAHRYHALFRQHGLDEFVILPSEYYRSEGLAFPHSYNQYVIRAPRRDQLRDHLAACGIDTAVYYPLPLHLQPCFAFLGGREGSLPASEQMARDALALPVYPGITPSQQEYVVDCVRRFYRGL